MSTFEEIIDRYARDARAFKTEIVPHNKSVLLKVLGDAGIGTVVITFDGEGDSGQINDLTAYAEAFDEPNDAYLAGFQAVALPDCAVLQQVRGYDHDAKAACWANTALPMPEALQNLAYGILEAEHGGWENNDGGFGEFVIHVAAGKIVLNFNWRVTTSEFEGAEF